MDCSKTGALIKRLRIEKQLTQKQLADKICVSDKTVSKWERGKGSPDVTLLASLSAELGVDIERMLDGELSGNSFVAGNMKKCSFFVCPECGNIVLGTGNAKISCCGRPLFVLNAKKAGESDKLSVEVTEDDWFITSAHPMEKEHYISFLAFATSENVNIIKLYPEWDLQKRLPKRMHGTLFWYCTKHGLFYQNI